MAVRSGVSIRLNLRLGAKISMDVVTMDNVLQIAKEALSNAVRHAGTTGISLDLFQSEGQIVLVIKDDGSGFDTVFTGRRAGDGLRNMAQRARTIGAVLSIVSAPGGGTTIRLQLPTSRQEL